MYERRKLASSLLFVGGDIGGYVVPLLKLLLRETVTWGNEREKGPSFVEINPDDSSLGNLRVDDPRFGLRTRAEMDDEWSFFFVDSDRFKSWSFVGEGNEWVTCPFSEAISRSRDAIRSWSKDWTHEWFFLFEGRK